ncbi:hypothetical protein JOM56_002302 [Amanita muscaria]
MKEFNLLDLRGAFADFLQHGGSNPSLVSGRCITDANAELPFHYIQIWTKLQIQNYAYHAPHNVLPPQTVNASPPSGSGHSDVILVNIDPSQIWPASGLKGHHVAELHLIFHACFDIIPQPNPQRLSQKGLFVEQSTRMYLLKRALQSNQSVLGGIVLLGQIRTLVDLILRFGKEAEKRLTKATVLMYSKEFCLNKYFEKELFYALKCH